MERLNLFEESEPRICVWCRNCAAVVVGPGSPWGYVCLGRHRDMSKRVKDVIRPFPPNVEFRTGLQCVNPDEMHDCFEPTRLTDERINLMDALGLR